jgi:hypothetical protein
MARGRFSSLGRSRAVRLWVLFAAALLGLILAKVGTEAAFRRQARASIAYDRRKYLLSYAARALLHHGIADVEARVNAGNPLVHERLGPDKYVVRFPATAFDEGAAGWRVEMRFVDGAVTRAVITPPDGGQLSRNTPEGWTLAEKARRATFALAAITWGSAGLLLAFARPWRRQIGQVCLAAGMAAIVAWILAPHFKLARSVTADMAVLAGAISAMVIALLMVLIPRRQTAPSQNCPSCGYDLTCNESGLCPECGKPTPAAIRRERLAQFDDAARALGRAAE